MPYMMDAPVKVNAPMQLTLDMFAKPSNSSGLLPPLPPPSTPVTGLANHPIHTASSATASSELIEEQFVRFQEAFAIFSFDFDKNPEPTTSTVFVPENEAPLTKASAEVIEEAFAAFEEAFGVFAWEP